jgi:aminocarboxymuconate-semialdehyde decarboxylase
MMKDDGTFFREVEEDLWSPEARIAYCDRVGIDVQVLSTVPVMFSYWAKPEDTLTVSQYLNNHIAGIVKKYPTRFVGLATLPMQSPKLAIRELRRVAKELPGMVGVQIGSHVNDWTLDNPELFPVFKECERLGMCLFVHPWDMMGQSLMKKYWLPWLVSMPAETSLAICSFIFGGIFERLPELRVLFAHGGGSFPATVGRVQHGFDCRPDLCAIDNPVSPEKYLGRFWVDSLIHGNDMLRFVSSLLTEDRVCLGSDYPFPLGECYPLKRPGDLIESSGLSDKIVGKMLGTVFLSIPPPPSLSFLPTRIINFQQIGTNALNWLGIKGKSRALLLNAPHRRSSKSTNLKREIAGTYRQKNDISLRLIEDGTFECASNDFRIEGKWKIGTYTSRAAPTGDVVLQVQNSKFERPGPWCPLPSTPYELKVFVKDTRLDGPLDAFNFEHVKRRSGKNDLIEGQKRVTSIVSAKL